MQNMNFASLHSNDTNGGLANSEQRRNSIHRVLESDQKMEEKSMRNGSKADFSAKDIPAVEKTKNMEEKNAKEVREVRVNDANTNGESKPQLSRDTNSPAVEQSRTLTDLIDPMKFDIGQPQPGKKKVTKEDFMKPQSKKDLAVDSNDPFAALDPLRSMK